MAQKKPTTKRITVITNKTRMKDDERGTRDLATQAMFNVSPRRKKKGGRLKRPPFS
jgi:hypothetical protein